MNAFTHLLAGPRDDAVLLDGLNALTAHHRTRCPAYAAMLDRLWPGGGTVAATLAEVPYLPVSLFKRLRLCSVPDENVVAELTSSGTTGQWRSRLPVDAETIDRQNRALSASLKAVLGAKRLPMLLLDTAAVLRDPALISARGAGLMGVMRHGRDHTFALAPDLTPERGAIDGFLARHGGGPFVLFGFTFLVWHFHLAWPGLRLENGILLHSGGWKAMADRAVDNSRFRAELSADHGLARIHNFYGMAEQLGSIFLEAEDGLLYPPPLSQAIIREPQSWRPAPPGREGVIQVQSLVPTSYPGHSLLTEDWGVMAPSGGLRVLGRVPKAPLRGCSDVLAQDGGR